MKPKFGGVPSRHVRGDWVLVEWVAEAKPGDPFPEPWGNAHAPLQAMIGRLVELGVIAIPAPDTDVATIAAEASAAARLWLQAHPKPPPAPQSVPRRMAWGPPLSAVREAASSADTAARLAEAARQFGLRAEQLQLPMVTGAEAMWQLNALRGSSERYYVTRRGEVRAGAADGATARPIDALSAQLADQLIDAMAATLANPQPEGRA